MHRLRFFGLVLMIPAFAFFAAGCGGSKDTGPKNVTTDDKPAEKKPLTAVEGKGTATIRGVVLYDGDPPPPEKLKFDEKAEKRCHEGDIESLVWEVDKNTKGVKNVVIWVKAGENKYFTTPDSLKKRPDVEMDQPFCNFKPHVVAMNTTYFDAKEKKQVPTGQQFTVKNSAPINHNTNWQGGPTVPENKDNKAVAPNGGMVIVPLKPCAEKQAGREDHVKIACNVHPFMSANAWVFDHPYYVLTDAEGKFEIKDVPAGVEIYIVAWHEETGKDGYFLPQGSPSRMGEKITLKEGETREFNLKIKK